MRVGLLLVLLCVVVVVVVCECVCVCVTRVCGCFDCVFGYVLTALACCYHCGRVFVFVVCSVLSFIHI